MRRMIDILNSSLLDLVLYSHATPSSGSLYHTGASTGWSGYTHPHPPHPHSLPHAPLSHGSPLYRHVLPVPMPHPVAGTHHPNVGVGAANHGPSATQTVPAVSTERHPPFMYNQQPYQQQHVPRRAEEPVLGGDSRSDGAQAQGRRGDESSEAMAMDDESKCALSPHGQGGFAPSYCIC